MKKRKLPYFEKKSLVKTAVFCITVLLLAYVIIPRFSSETLVLILVGALFFACFVIYILYLSAYEKETHDHSIWDFGISAGRIPQFSEGAYKRNILALNFYLCFFLAVICQFSLILL